MAYLSPDDVATKIGVTAKTVREWLKSEEIIGVKLGGSWKIHENDLSRYIDGRRLEALLSKAEEIHPNMQWQGGQCVCCFEIIPTPSPQNDHWVCSIECKKKYDREWSQIVGSGSDEAIYNQGKVIPHF